MDQKQSQDQPQPQPEPVEGIDFYINPAGKRIWLPAHHLKRGFCCGGKCRNCPYDWEMVPREKLIEGEPRPPMDLQAPKA